LRTIGVSIIIRKTYSFNLKLGRASIPKGFFLLFIIWGKTHWKGIRKVIIPDFWLTKGLETLRNPKEGRLNPN